MNSLRRHGTTVRISAIGLVVILLATCSGDVTGIFYTLATQTSRADRNLPNNVAVANVVRVEGTGESDDQDRFYVAATSLWTRPVDGDKWSQVNNPSADGGVVTVLSLAYHDDQLYAGFLFDGAGNTDTFGVYRTTERIKNTLKWSELPVSGIDGKQVVRLLVAGPTLLAITKDGDVWELHRLLEDTGSFTAVTLPAAAGRVHDVAYDRSAYWVTTDDAVYSGDILDDTPDLTKHQPNDSDESDSDESDYAGVVNALGRVYVSDRQGNVHWQEGTEWESQRITPNDEPLTEFIYLEDRKQILVGTESLGFYSFEAGDGSPTKVTRHPHFANKALYNAHVQRFAYLPEGDSKHLFAITFTDGLFSTTPNSLNNWNQE